MTLHLIKLCVGVDSVEDLQDWIDIRARERRATGAPPAHSHTTRMTPKRTADLLDGGSLFWVIRGHVQVRQRLLDIAPFVDTDGVQRCRLVLDPALALTEWRPRRPFQGWRYLRGADAPADLGLDRTGLRELPATLRRELVELGLL